MDFKINLIKDRVPGLKKRKRLFLAMFIYIVLCSIGFVSLCCMVTVNFLESRSSKLRLATLEKKFYAERSGQADVFKDAMVMKNRIIRHIAMLEKIDKVLSKRIDFSTLYLRFQASLPLGVYIDNLNLDSGSRKIDFDLVVPVNRMQGGFDTSTLISSWKDDEVLMSYIENIESSLIKRKGKGSVLKISCTLSS